MGNWPPMWTMVLFLTFPIGLIVALTLAFTGYGWGSAAFMFGIPTVPTVWAWWSFDRGA